MQRRAGWLLGFAHALPHLEGPPLPGATPGPPTFQCLSKKHPQTNNVLRCFPKASGAFLVKLSPGSSEDLERLACELWAPLAGRHVPRLDTRSHLGMACASAVSVTLRTFFVFSFTSIVTMLRAEVLGKLKKEKTREREPKTSIRRMGSWLSTRTVIEPF